LPSASQRHCFMNSLRRTPPATTKQRVQPLTLLFA
jgi:hypothetical protein